LHTGNDKRGGAISKESCWLCVCNADQHDDQFRWSKDNALRQWLRNTRLDGFGKMVAELSQDDTERQAILAQLRTRAMAAMSNMPNLLIAVS
jgi:hypothetical protein